MAHLIRDVIFCVAYIHIYVCKLSEICTDSKNRLFLSQPNFRLWSNTLWMFFPRKDPSMKLELSFTTWTQILSQYEIFFSSCRAPNCLDSANFHWWDFFMSETEVWLPSNKFFCWECSKIRAIFNYFGTICHNVCQLLTHVGLQSVWIQMSLSNGTLFEIKH